MAAYQASCPGLPGLTGVQLENAALVYYGPFADRGPYYVPNNDCTGWSVNPNNTDGVNYANGVWLDPYAFNRKQKYFKKPQVKRPQVVG